MKILDYLKAIKECPDEFVKYDRRQIHRLTYDWGVYDNFGILINGDLKAAVEDLRKTREFKEVVGFMGMRMLGHLPGVVTIASGENETYGALAAFDCAARSKEARKYYDFCKQRFNSYLLLHTSRFRKKQGEISWERYFALAINKIARCFVKANISFCFPDSRGWKNPQDLSQIVYFPDKLEEEARRLS